MNNYTSKNLKENEKVYQSWITNLKSESDVEIKFVSKILSFLGYENEHIQWKKSFSFKEGSKRSIKIVDTYVELDNEKLFIVESKKPTEKLEEALNQADFYAFNLEARYSLITNGKEILLRGYGSDNKRYTIFKSNIILSKMSLILEEIYKYLSINNIKRNVEIKISNDIITTEKNFILDLKKCHNIIRKFDNLDPNDAFTEMSKLLFIKISEESRLKENLSNRYSYKKIVDSKKDDMQKSYINKIFHDTISNFPKIFADNEEISLSDECIMAVMKILEKYDIYDLPIDIKGKAFESFLSNTLRGKGLGQFFTPRPIVEFMVRMTYLKSDDIILDLACGTGGFLIAAFNKIVNVINQTPKNIITNKNEYINKIRFTNFFGVDAEPKAARTAKMNMTIWGDGENIYRGNGLDLKSYLNEKYPFNKGVDVILMNPPFGKDEPNEEILNNLSFGSYTKKTELLFIERAINLLNDKGRLSIVIPDSVLTAQSSLFTRKFIMENCKIDAIISLPKFAFKQSGADVQTSVIFLTKERDIKNYKIFLGKAKNIGYSASGKSTIKLNEKTDLDLLLSYFDSKTENFDKNFIYMNSNDFFKENRWDARFHIFSKKLSKIKSNLVELSNYIFDSKQKINPQNYPESYFNILTVTNEEGILFEEDNVLKSNIMGIDFNQEYIKVSEGDIVYNPYRINVGSIGIIPKEYEGFLISPAYVCFKTKLPLKPESLLYTLKSDFYGEYIDIIGTGSVRNNLTFDILKEILVPKKVIETNDFSNIYTHDLSLINEKNKIKEEVNSKVNALINI